MRIKAVEKILQVYKETNRGNWHSIGIYTQGGFRFKGVLSETCIHHHKNCNLLFTMLFKEDNLTVAHLAAGLGGDLINCYIDIRSIIAISYNPDPPQRH